jgi:hypothetical protein
MSNTLKGLGGIAAAVGLMSSDYAPIQARRDDAPKPANPKKKAKRKAQRIARRRNRR